MKIGCVIQGDIRRGTIYLLEKLPIHFDFTVVSTWQGSETRFPAGKYSVITSEKPINPGINNRNLQRLTTARGIAAAKEAGCDYILKWRTDMLPTNLDINQLLEWANFKVPIGMNSRIVMPAYRNLSIDPDWLSSIPDLFAFGHISELEMLWGDSKFDYSESINMPKQMQHDLSPLLAKGLDLQKLYMAESELYAIYKSRLEDKFCLKFIHSSIACDYFRLIDYRKLKILWFNKDSGFRSIGQAWEHPWWTVNAWNNGGVRAKAYRFNAPGFLGAIRKAISLLRTKCEVLWQGYLWKNSS